MLYLLFTIVFTVCLFLFFKEFSRWRVDTFQAIVFNYLGASVLGGLFGEAGYSSYVVLEDWFYPTLLLGVLFIVIFNVMALTIQKLGVGIGALASKMSLVIPVFAAFFFQNDSLSFTKLMGISLALIAIYLSLQKEDGKSGSFYLAILLFLGAGLLDTLLSQIRYNYLATAASLDHFTVTVFAVAFSIGIAILIAKKTTWSVRSILAGLLLAIPNYFSIYFMLRTLEVLDSSLVFSTLNISVVLLSALIGWAHYKEFLSLRNWTGIVLAIFSILMLMFA